MIAPRSRPGLGALLASAALLVARPAGADPTCGGEVHQNDCGSGNIYPCCDNGGNCTWWAWESVCRNWHVAMVNWGNANTWAANAHLDPSFDVLSSPVVGSIATRDLGTFGHVAWVVAVNGGNVTVTEENCCDTCAPGMRTWTYPASYFNSGYVVRHGVTCQCTPGETQSEACGDCGARSRTCDPGCNWGGFGACEGPDPGGGNMVCETGDEGPCGEGRLRCVGGSTACKALVTPSPEVCDGVDNDCNGEIDDGHPAIAEGAASPPDFAAELVDVSYPESLRCGERATIWADFRNVGAEPWAEEGLWLEAGGAGVGQASALFTAERWPAWDVAAVLDRPVRPGEIGRFVFEITAPVAPGEVAERFQLRVPEGGPITCPRAEIQPSIRVLPAAPGDAGGAGGAGGGAAEGDHAGCSQRPLGPSNAPFGILLSAAMFVAARARRRG